jgi:hypothetical protein
MDFPLRRRIVREQAELIPCDATNEKSPSES